MVELEIDGKPITAPEGASIIEAADEAGIYIPRFCYHQKLSIAANCRMCLVEVEKVGKPLPACATPVTPNMKVFTQSKKALEAQRVVMEFLLINHPLDCPICDQGGQCELQDQAMGYGGAYSYYDEPKRAVYSEDIGSLVETWMTRCIHCTRCVRFGEEVAGLRELGVVNRGEHSEISTYVKHFMKSELSGNIIDLCPVGALTDKPSRYQARGWEMVEHPHIAPHDCVGSNIYVHSRSHVYSKERTVHGVVPRQNESINETWISDRDRFSYEGLHHQDRVTKPRMKKNGRWIEVDWERALVEIADRTRGIIQNQGEDQIAAIASPNSTTEELYVLQKLIRALGSNHIDHRIRGHDFSDQHLAPEFPNLGLKIAEIPDLTSIFLVGSNERFEQPMLGHRINMAKQEGAKVTVINPVDYPFTFAVDEKMIVTDIVQALAQVVKALADEKGVAYPALAEITPSDQAKRIASTLKQGESTGIFLGAFALEHQHAAVIRTLVRIIRELTNAHIGVMTNGANGSGAWLAGAVPHRSAAGEQVEKPGLTAKELLTTDPVRAYFLLNIEPELDTAYSAAALKALEDAGLVVCLTPFATDRMQEYADFILPIAPFSETAGTFVNIEGSWQHFSAVSVPHGESKPAWKVFRVLANLLELDGFEYQSAHQIKEELFAKVSTMPTCKPQKAKLDVLPAPLSNMIRLGSWPMYRTDNLVRRAKALQETMHEHATGIIMNQDVASQLNVQNGDMISAVQGDSRVSLPVRINNCISDFCVWIPSGLEATAGFGETMAQVILERGAA